MKVGDVITWKVIMIAVQQLLRLLSDNSSIKPGLSPLRIFSKLEDISMKSSSVIHVIEICALQH